MAARLTNQLVGMESASWLGFGVRIVMSEVRGFFGWLVMLGWVWYGGGTLMTLMPWDVARCVSVSGGGRSLV